MNTYPTTVVFDIDGTLANIDHRRHFVSSKPKNWMAFRRGMANDPVNWDIQFTLLAYKKMGCTILIASGRNEEDRAVTTQWLDDTAQLKGLYEKLYLRADKDYRADNIVKSEILDQMIADGYNPTIAVDDRRQVVDMWRQRGLRCLQVDPGDF